MLATRVSFFLSLNRRKCRSHSTPFFPFSRTQSLRKFEVLGGVVPGTEESRGKISLDRPNRQWDYPCVIASIEIQGGILVITDNRYAWPPHQIMIWVGLERYGYLEEAQRLAYRFLYMSVLLSLVGINMNPALRISQDDHSIR